RDLYRSESQPEQSYSERQLYEAALDRMAREIAAVEKLDERGAVQRITEVLSKSAKGRRIAAEEAEVKAARRICVPRWQSIIARSRRDRAALFRPEVDQALGGRHLGQMGAWQSSAHPGLRSNPPSTARCWGHWWDCGAARSSRE